MNAIPEKELLKEEMLKKSTSPPFPQALHGKKGIRNAAEILEVLRQVKVNIPLLDMIKQVPTHDWRKGSGESLARLGSKCEFASISVYKQLGLGELKPTAITLSLADRSVKIPRGQITPEEEEGPEELCIIDTLVEEHCNQHMQEKLNESLEDIEEFSESPIGLATLQIIKRMVLMEVLRRCKKAIGWQISDLKGISPLVCTHSYIYGGGSKANSSISKKVGSSSTRGGRAEVLKLLQAESFTLFLIALGSGKDHFTCPFGTFAYRRMPFGLCNAPATFQRCMLSIFSDMVERIMEVFMDDITIYGGTFEECLVNLEAVLHRCIEKDLVLNWEKCHFMVRQGIVLGHIISEKGIEVDKAKLELIAKLPSPTTVKGVSDFAIGAVLGQREDGSPIIRSSNQDKKGVENVVADHLSRTGSTSLPKFILIIGKSPFSLSIVQIRSLGSVSLKMSSKGFYLIVMRMHVEATLPLKKQP
ncbi:Retrovirus-related Pol polyprotein from transposon 17.6 [Vitis vinifera]|uniref:Retrovirus-related Pol polyprotein from transposon 17.6 n=1 Tax=Vitis vinifera TaxID=29760 RepID=A0A438GBA1_VITVI|nr:Retrovirus-related Pol polyprotein from transposon 17.6 [Vitis vinifera]